MSVINVDNHDVASIIRDNNLLSNSYTEEQMLQDLNSLYYQPWILGKHEEEEIKDYFKKIHSLITNSCKFSSKNDLKTLSISDTKDPKTNLSELDEKVKQYFEYNNLKLPTISSIACNQKMIIAKVEYCRRLSIPCIDDNGVVIEELFDLSKSNLCFGRFHEMLNEYVKTHNDDNYINAVVGAEEDNKSKAYALIQTYTYNKYHRFAQIPNNLKSMLDASLEDPSTDIEKLVQTIYLKLKESNDFIEDSSLEEIEFMTKSRYDEENRGCNRR